MDSTATDVVAPYAIFHWHPNKIGWNGMGAFSVYARHFGGGSFLEPNGHCVQNRCNCPDSIKAAYDLLTMVVRNTLGG